MVIGLRRARILRIRGLLLCCSVIDGDKYNAVIHNGEDIGLCCFVDNMTTIANIKYC